MWRHAGLERSPEGLDELTTDPHPLARLVATCGLAREESRGAHRRTDFPGMSSSLNGTHTVISAAGAVALEPWT
jgi:L-aspartate oxidase